MDYSYFSIVKLEVFYEVIFCHKTQLELSLLPLMLSLFPNLFFVYKKFLGVKSSIISDFQWFWTVFCNLI